MCPPPGYHVSWPSCRTLGTLLGHGIFVDIRGQLGGIHDAGTAGSISLDIANGYRWLMPADVEAVRGDDPTEAGRGEILGVYLSTYASRFQEIDEAREVQILLSVIANIQ